MATIYDIIEENLRNQAIQRDIARDNQGQGIGSIDQRFMGSAPSNDINQIILNNIAQLSDANQGFTDTSDVPQEQNFFDYLQNLSGGAVNFAKNIADKGIGFTVGTSAGAMINPYLALGGGILGLTKGVGMFDRSQSQINFDNLSPQNQAYTSSLYRRQRDGTPGLLEGYNQISARGVGALGTLQNRLGTIQNTLARQINPSSVLQQREQQISDAIYDIITEKDRTAGMNAPNNIGLGDGGGDSSGDSSGNNDAGYSAGQSAGMGFGGGRSDPTDKS